MRHGTAPENQRSFAQIDVHSARRAACEPVREATKFVVAHTDKVDVESQTARGAGHPHENRELAAGMVSVDPEVISARVVKE
jgi:hypothetical protein